MTAPAPRLPPPWESTRVWTTSDPVGAQHSNAYMRDNLDHLGTPVATQASILVTPSTVSTPNQWTPISFDWSGFDTTGMHDFATNPTQMVIPAGYPGIYKLTTNIQWDFSLGATLYVAVYRNANQVNVVASDKGAAPPPAIGTYYLLCQPGDVIEVWGFQETSTSLNVLVGSSFTLRKVSNVPSIASPAWVNTTTFAALGALPTVTQINDYWQTNQDHLGTPLSVQAFCSGNLNTTNNTTTLLHWDSENWDTNSIHSTSSNTSKFTVPAGFDGLFEVSVNAIWIGSASGQQRLIQLYQNGSLVQSIASAPVSSANTVANGTYQVSCAAGDVLEFYGFQDSGGSLAIQALATVTILRISN